MHTLCAESFWGFEGERSNHIDKVWAVELQSFSEEEYREAVDAVLGAFEASVGRSLEPGETGRVALNVYTNSGVGLHTPHALTLGVIQELEERGFERSDMLIVDARENALRAAGYLPPLSARFAAHKFEGVPVVSLDSTALWDENWYYENPLPVQYSSPLGRELLGNIRQEVDEGEMRKSYLPEALLTGVDFWINLPMVTDHPALGMSGALANATLWSVSNRDRFFLSPANAPIAVAEISAVPELLSNWALTLLPLERYQFIGGPQFNRLYSRSEKLLLGSVNPVALDAEILGRMNAARAKEGFAELVEPLPQLEYASQVGVGPISGYDIVRLNPAGVDRSEQTQPADTAQ